MSPACDAPRRVHSFVTCVGCAMLRARLRHLHGLLQAGCMPVSPACAAPRCVHSFVTRGCCAMSRASLRHLCVSRHAACIPAPPVRARPGKKKEKRRFVHEHTTGITNTHTNCPPYIVHPTQSTTNYHSVSRHTDDQNNSVVVAVVNILHKCRTVRSLPSSYVITNGTS